MWRLAVLLVLAGCGTGEGGSPGRVAARVNGTEISVQHMGAGMPAQAVDKVIDRELLVQQALKDRLDADPAVAREMEDARRDVLAQAWLERAAAAKAKSTPQEVQAFYAENPALFAARRIYRLRELDVTLPEDEGAGMSGPLREQVRAEAANVRDLEEAAGWLKWRELQVGPVTASTMAAEELPLAWLPQLARMSAGEIAVFASPLGVQLVQLVQAKDAPLKLEEAAPRIGRFLAARKKLEVAQAEVKRLRAQASIEYVGDFKR